MDRHTLYAALRKIRANTTQEGNCLLWTGTVDGKKAFVKIGDKKLSPRRILFIHQNGGAPRKLYARCGNPLCVSVLHASPTNSKHRPRCLDKYSEQPNGCWYPHIKPRRDGYSKFTLGKRQVFAHRLFYTHLVGPIPPKAELDHLCKDRRCVNPKHLEPVSKHVNQQRGANAKLTPDIVREIRRRAGVRGEQARMAREFGVSQALISQVVKGKIWPNVS